MATQVIEAEAFATPRAGARAGRADLRVDKYVAVARGAAGPSPSRREIWVEMPRRNEERNA